MCYKCCLQSNKREQTKHPKMRERKQKRYLILGPIGTRGGGWRNIFGPKNHLNEVSFDFPSDPNKFFEKPIHNSGVTIKWTNLTVLSKFNF